MRKAVTAAGASAALIFPYGSATAAATAAKAKPKKKVVTLTRTVTGSQGSAGRWGDVQVTLVVRKTTTTIGRRKRVARRIAKVEVPVYPNHTDRSVFINQQAIPLLTQEVLKAGIAISNLQLVSGATATSYGFANSLQDALLQAKQI